MDLVKFPDTDLAHFRAKQDRYYHAAAVCGRGHEQTTTVSPEDRFPSDAKCPACGAHVLVACRSCGLRIRDRFHIEPYMAEKHSMDPTWERPTFCDRCGSAHPWASRERRIFELEDMLDGEEIDEADRVFVHDRLRELRKQDA